MHLRNGEKIKNIVEKGISYIYADIYIKKTNKQCRRTIAAQRPNFYTMPFAGVDCNSRLFYHPNKHIFCKRHLNRISS